VFSNNIAQQISQEQGNKMKQVTQITRSGVRNYVNRCSIASNEKVNDVIMV
jgi:hypothetical protein